MPTKGSNLAIQARWAVLLALMLVPLQVRAEEPDATSRARSHFEIGRGLYRLGNYTDALKEFAAGYELSPKSDFLINLGQCYRRLGQADKAREMFQKYLAEAPPNEPNRAQVRRLLQEVDSGREPSDERSPSAEPILPTPVPARLVEAAPTTAVQIAVPAQPAAPLHRNAKRLWWILPASVTLAVGIGLGVYFGVHSQSHPSCMPTDIGCLDLR